MKKIILFLLFLVSKVVLSEPAYFLCGSDEDGCPKEHPDYCACIPRNEEFYDKPYCMNLDSLTCKPLSQVGSCEVGYILSNQVDCLALMMQSVSSPSCALVSYSYCLENQVFICNEDGNPARCDRR